MLKLTGMQLLIIVLFSKNIVYIMLAYEMFTHILINFLKSYYLLEYDINWWRTSCTVIIFECDQ